MHSYGNTAGKCTTTSRNYTNVPAFTTDQGGALSSLYTKKSNYQIAVNKAGLYLFELRAHVNSLTANKRVELAPFVNDERNAALASSYNTAGSFTLTKIVTLSIWLNANDTIDFRIAPVDAAEVSVELGDVLVYAIDWDDKFKIPDYTGYANETKDLRVGADGTTYDTAGQAMREQIGSIKEDLSNKITKFYASNQGETHLADSDNGKIQDMMIYGKSSQDGTPTPENPVEIKSVVNPTVKVTNEDGLKVQTVALPYTLNAIPVSSDGNVTINGQQYVADYVDVERGKLTRMCKEKVFDGTEKWRSELSYMVADIPNFSYVDNNNHKHMTYLLCNKYKVSTTVGNNDNLIFIRINGDGVVIKDTLHQSTVDDWKKYLNDNPCIVHCLSAIPEEIDLTTEEIIAFKSLVTCYPTTNISVNSEQLDGYTVFNYPISMQNGWNYVKQQLNDNRDYIYDMDTKTQDIDTQAAEAYVNSEYAVALTELEA